ncbi:MAG: hypothetical protein F2667_02685 [Actinobacteria bacterium]|uniref:Unannotated protein n=1 Tax=freshwater metagenome TaxID=449393 RepID=A0A6J6P1R7_9ZZZZ|nr:hypothetical protein [Actinomycetota bacterium]
MTSSEAPGHLAYDELTSPHDMHADCEAASHNLHLAERPDLVLVGAHSTPAVREIEFPIAAQRLANALHLHLD